MTWLGLIMTEYGGDESGLAERNNNYINTLATKEADGPLTKRVKRYLEKTKMGSSGEPQSIQTAVKKVTATIQDGTGKDEYSIDAQLAKQGVTTPHSRGVDKEPVNFNFGRGKVLSKPVG